VNRERNEREGGYEMENLVMLGQAAIGLGVLLMGLAALWFVWVYQEKKD
jgi:hypothetical protein